MTTETTDYRALCVELTEHLSLLDDPPHELVVRAQAALAQQGAVEAGADKADAATICAKFQALIELLASKKEGNQELMIYYRWDCDRSWDIELGNPPGSPVPLGEAMAEIFVSGPSLATAVESLAAELNASESLRHLAQLEPAGPTDEELQKAADAMRDENDTLSLVDFARTVLQRWGSPTPTPIPVSPHRPADEDSDANGRCWAWNPESLWWDYWQPKFIRMNAGDPYTHWLPGSALPLPPTA